MARRSHRGQAIDITKQLGAFTSKSAKLLAVEVHGNLVAAPSQGGTPVDTGFARSKWIPKVGAPGTGDTAEGGASNNTEGQASSGNVSDAAAQAALARIVAFYKIEQGSIFMTNSAPYITRLNEGWSKQAGAGFVQRAIAKGIKAVETRL